MEPERASVTADTILAVFWENSVTLIAVFVYTALAFPWFVGIFFVEFNSVVI